MVFVLLSRWSRTDGLSIVYLHCWLYVLLNITMFLKAKGKRRKYACPSVFDKIEHLHSVNPVPVPFFLRSSLFAALRGTGPHAGKNVFFSRVGPSPPEGCEE